MSDKIDKLADQLRASLKILKPNSPAAMEDALAFNLGVLIANHAPGAPDDVLTQRCTDMLMQILSGAMTQRAYVAEQRERRLCPVT